MPSCLRNISRCLRRRGSRCRRSDKVAATVLPAALGGCLPGVPSQQPGLYYSKCQSGSTANLPQLPGPLAAFSQPIVAAGRNPEYRRYRHKHTGIAGRTLMLDKPPPLHEARFRLLGGLPKPDFLVIGAAKAGTTSLSSYLSHHQSVEPVTFKEPNFFTWQLMARERYQGLFVNKRRRQGQANCRGLLHFLPVTPAGPKTYRRTPARH